MQNFKTSSTIAAIATASGKAGIGVVRISGAAAKQIGAKICGAKLRPRHAHYRPFANREQKIIDYGIAIYFPAPHSYTGEDVLELQAHGGQVVLNMLLETAIFHGASMAKPGEFTERAYLNNKLSLTQAEAVIDLINASTEQAALAAMESLTGSFGKKIDVLLASLIELRSNIEASFDFIDEDIEQLSANALVHKLDGVLKNVEAVLLQSQRGQLLRDGIDVVILGPANAGKSSLLNHLCDSDKAIVSDIAGTTRDVLEAVIQIDGVALNIIDTAGIRETSDKVEQLGVKKAWQAIERADVLIAVVAIESLDLNNLQPLAFLDAQDFAIIERLKNKIPLIKVVNKIDKISREERTKLAAAAADTLFISVKDNINIKALLEQLKSIIGIGNIGEGVHLARQRHLLSLHATAEHLQLAKTHLGAEMSDLAASELYYAQQQLAQISGEFSADDLLGEIFSSFCIGK